MGWIMQAGALIFDTTSCYVREKMEWNHAGRSGSFAAHTAWNAEELWENLANMWAWHCDEETTGSMHA